MFPTAVSKAFVTALLAGKECLTGEDYIADLLAHVAEYDSLRLKSALEMSKSPGHVGVFPEEMSHFLFEFLSEYGLEFQPLLH